MRRLFILIYVHRGFIQDPEIFFQKEDAELRMMDIKQKGFNPDYDEVSIFEKAV